MCFLIFIDWLALTFCALDRDHVKNRFLTTGTCYWLHTHILHIFYWLVVSTWKLCHIFIHWLGMAAFVEGSKFAKIQITTNFNCLKFFSHIKWNALPFVNSYCTWWVVAHIHKLALEPLWKSSYVYGNSVLKFRDSFLLYTLLFWWNNLAMQIYYSSFTSLCIAFYTHTVAWQPLYFTVITLYYFLTQMLLKLCSTDVC